VQEAGVLFEISFPVQELREKLLITLSVALLVVLMTIEGCDEGVVVGITTVANTEWPFADGSHLVSTSVLFMSW